MYGLAQTFEYRAGRNKALRKLKKKLKKKKKFRTKKLTTMQKRAEHLNTHLPLSEKWFQQKFRSESFYKGHFFNVAMTHYIPDVVCFDYRYTIEIDGEYHNADEMKIKDAKKDAYFKSRGYVTFRIKAFDDKSYTQAITTIKDHRKNFLSTITLK